MNNIKRVLVFDTETNGKLKNWSAKVTDYDQFPRVTQLGWMIIDIDTGTTQEKESMIYPRGWEIPVEKFFIKNNMSTQRCMDEGIDMELVLEEFCSDVDTVDLLIAHNIDFDHKVLSAEMIRYNIKPTKRVPKFCTMKSTTDLCKLPGQYGSYKWPQLIELHQYLFGCDFEGAHDAMDDVRATGKCFVELLKNQLITIT